MAFQYMALADDVENKILKGDFVTGEKLPSLRKMHQEFGYSITTIHQAYLELEKRGIVEAKEKSGFFVRAALQNASRVPDLMSCKAEPQKVNVNTLYGSISKRLGDPGISLLGHTIPSNDIIPLKQFSRIFKSLDPQNMDEVFGYDWTQGSLDLRRKIARRSLGYNKRVSSSDVIITNGCMEAVSICLKAVAKPGDVIGVESPTYNGFLQLIEENAMYALELPTTIEEGVDVRHLENKLDSYQVKACLFNPSFQNPLGFVMPMSRRQALVALLNKKDIPIIEDDAFGDLHFQEKRPPTLKSFDKKGLVLYCSSFSKTLAPGLKVGWMIPGRLMDRVMELKSNLNLTASKLNQHLIVQFMRNGSYDRQLRHIQNELRKQMCDVTRAVLRYFPKDTKISSPRGGLNLWVQLNDSIDGVELYKEAVQDNILVVPGVLCSGSGKYQNCIRIGCGRALDKKLEKTIQTVGDIIYDMII
jgi:DNA-binding transcriptional MocR family regulator